MPERHSLSLSLNIHGSVQQKSKYYARKAQSILHVAYIWLVTEEIKYQEGRRSLSSTLDIHAGLGAAEFESARKAWSISLTFNIYGSVHQKSNARNAQSITDVEYTWLGAAEIKCREGTVYHLR